METYSRIKIFRPTSLMSYQQFDLVVDHLHNREGLKLLRWTPNMIKVEYNPHIYDISMIKEGLENIGIQITIKTKKGAISRLLNTMVKENQESFGSKKLDCCDLNGNQSNRKNGR